MMTLCSCFFVSGFYQDFFKKIEQIIMRLLSNFAKGEIHYDYRGID